MRVESVTRATKRPLLSGTDSTRTRKPGLNVFGVIPYDRIVAIDEAGDEFFEGPQVYCQFIDGVPFTGTNALVDPVERFGARGIWVGDDDEGRIEKFAPEMRLTNRR